jgi:DNA repair protein RadA/Sms
VGLNGQDIVVNVTGGLRTSETAADLGVALAIASSARDMPIASGVAAAGEVGLSGEVRAVPQLERRISEAARLGLSKFIVPGRGRRQRTHEGGLEVVPVSTVRQALGAALERPEGGPRKSGDE